MACGTSFPIGTKDTYFNEVADRSTIKIVVGFVAVVASCQPLEYYWDTTVPGGFCASTSIVTGISYLVSIMAIITDWTCALVPCYVVWNLQMKSRLKASVCGVLALGIVASAATVIRLPYLRYYNIALNYNCTHYMLRIASTDYFANTRQSVRQCRQHCSMVHCGMWRGNYCRLPSVAPNLAQIMDRPLLQRRFLPKHARLLPARGIQQEDDEERERKDGIHHAQGEGKYDARHGFSEGSRFLDGAGGRQQPETQHSSYCPGRGER